MEKQGNLSEKMTTVLWQYVLTEDYKPPEGMVTESLRGGIAGLWRKLRSPRKAADTVFEPKKDLEVLSETLFEKKSRLPDWQMAVPVLSDTLLPWIDAPGTNPVALVVGLQRSGNADVLRLLAKEKKWKTITLPTLKQVFSGDEKWLDNFDKKGRSPWVLPTLERCFLRHVNGLTLVRSFFEKLLAGQLGRGIIGCDSWAWAFLKHALNLRLPVKWVTQSLDHERLSLWLQGLSSPDKEECLIFRQTDNGSYVLPPPPEMQGVDDKDDNTSEFLEKLAAHSRGIPGISWALWRNSLNTVPGENIDKETGKENCSIRQVTFWVTPWGKMNLPSAPASQERDQILVLHTLLLHNGLAPDVLSKILPLPPQVVKQALFSFMNSGILEQDQALWRVSALAYPQVRSLLNGEGYLVDDF